MEESRNRMYKTCPDCGANLDPGERCDCQPERLHPLPRDGLRARCPYFSQRVDHQGEYRIQCVRRPPDTLIPEQDGLFFPSRQARDEEYMRRCCAGGYCDIRMIWTREEAEGR